MDISKKKIMVVFGTRPEATKMGTVIKELRKNSQWLETLVVVTGQHREQLYEALGAFDIKPDIDLEIMKTQQTPAYVLSRATGELDEIINRERPDLVLVHGDTQTTVSAALTAAYNKVPVGHVEAGLRTYNKYSPWPEEINRCIIDTVSTLFFAPTSVNKQNLLNERVDEKYIYVTGQTQTDSAMVMYDPDYVFKEEVLRNIDYTKRVIAITAHRRENYGEPMEQMFRAIRKTADANPDITMVYPIHLSPIVQKTAREILSGHERIVLLNAIEYREMINLIARSYFVMSDSGGLQEECPVFKKPLILMRDTTERPEGVEAGITLLSGTGEKDIFDAANLLLNSKEEYIKRSEVKNPYGDGRASERIVKAIAHYFGIINEAPEEFK